MATQQGDLALLDDQVAQELLHSTNLARLAYTWRDGTPRVIPIWFHWDGEAIVLGSPPNAPKVDVLPTNSKVALTIDRDFGEELGREWVEGVRQMSPQMARISDRPEWVSILDFERRFPSAIQSAMSGQ